MNENKIYCCKDEEYQKDGHLLINGIDYFTIKTYKNNYLSLEDGYISDYRDQNDIDSQQLVVKSKEHEKKIYKIKPLKGTNPFLFCFDYEVLYNYYEKYTINLNGKN